MKKIPIAVFILFVSSILCGEKNYEAYSYLDNLRVREKPDINGTVVSSIKINEKLLLTGEANGSLSIILRGQMINGSWLKCKNNDTEGWVYSGALEICSLKDDKKLNELIKNFKKSDTYYFIPDGYEINILAKPHLGSEIEKKIKGPYYLIVKGIADIDYPFLKNKRTWIYCENSIDGYQISGYVLTDFLIDNITRNKSVKEMLSFFNNYSRIDDEVKFKSLKRYQNGDGDASWEDEACFDINFKNCYISTGYMYNHNTLKIIDIIKNSKNKYTFKTQSINGFNEGKYIDFDFEIVDSSSIIISNYGELSGKYIFGEAEIMIETNK